MKSTGYVRDEVDSPGRPEGECLHRDPAGIYRRGRATRCGGRRGRYPREWNLGACPRESSRRARVAGLVAGSQLGHLAEQCEDSRRPRQRSDRPLRGRARRSGSRCVPGSLAPRGGGVRDASLAAPGRLFGPRLEVVEELRSDLAEIRIHRHRRSRCGDSAHCSPRTTVAPSASFGPSSCPLQAKDRHPRRAEDGGDDARQSEKRTRTRLPLLAGHLLDTAGCQYAPSP